MATSIKPDVAEEAREQALQERIKAGFVLEDADEMTPRYRESERWRSIHSRGVRGARRHGET